MNEIKLIALYSYICDCYDKNLRWYCQRFSNNNLVPEFTDQECLTIYLFAIMEEEKFKIKSIHTYAEKYLKSWFPKLPSYAAFNSRINFMASALVHLVGTLIDDLDGTTVKSVGIHKKA